MSRLPRAADRTKKMAVYALYATLMFLSAQIDIIPNVHQLTLFLTAFTVVYRAEALIPLYLYVFLEGIFGGFDPLWWPPYLYIWLLPWALTMLIPKGTREWLAGLLITLISGLHGILFGALYAPYQCLVVFHGNFKMMVPWILYGLSFDTAHMLGNLAASLLALPLARLLCRLEKKPYRFRKALPKEKK